MKTIFVVGGNGFARECASYLIELERAEGSIKFGGFLSHNGYKINYGNFSKYYVGDLDELNYKSGMSFVVGAGYPEIRKRIFYDLREKGLPFYNLIALGCKLSDDIDLGEGNVFAPPFRASVNMKIGCGNVFNGSVITGHDDTIGNFNFFGPGCKVLGDVIIGNENVIGTGAVLMPKAKIGNNNRISPMSVIFRGCKDFCYMHGNPALKVGKVEK